MSKVMTSFIVAAIALSSGPIGCARVDQDPQIGESSQALSGKELDYEYYSDSTYATQVGGYFAPCTGLPSSWGTRTRYIIGSQTACRTGAIVGCWQIIDGREVCNELSCVLC